MYNTKRRAFLKSPFLFLFFFLWVFIQPILVWVCLRGQKVLSGDRGLSSGRRRRSRLAQKAPCVSGCCGGVACRKVRRKQIAPVFKRKSTGPFIAAAAGLEKCILR